MSASAFEFTDSWVVPAAPEDVRDVLVDLERYPEWWPQVRAVAKLGEDDARVLCRASLPYMLDLLLHAESRDLPTVRVGLDGDLVGWAAWTLVGVEGGTRLDFSQQVRLTSLPGWAIAIVRPLMVWNHHQMMQGAKDGLTALRWPP